MIEYGVLYLQDDRPHGGRVPTDPLHVKQSEASAWVIDCAAGVDASEQDVVQAVEERKTEERDSESRRIRRRR